MTFDSFKTMLKALLQGEPLRVIAYGAVAVVWIATHAAFAAGVAQSPAPDFDAILLAVSAAVATVTELARKFVFSPVTAERLVSEAYEAGQEAEKK